jgi:hypothetical protein
MGIEQGNSRRSWKPAALSSVGGTGSPAELPGGAFATSSVTFATLGFVFSKSTPTVTTAFASFFVAGTVSEPDASEEAAVPAAEERAPV